MKGTKLKKLSSRDKETLRKLVKWQCEQCKKNEEDVGTLQVHRIKRESKGGEYTLRNIKMLCLDCHRAFHANELGEMDYDN